MLSKMIFPAFVIPALPLEASEEENEGQLHVPFDNFKALPITIIYAILQLHILVTSFQSGYVSKIIRF